MVVVVLMLPLKVPLFTITVWSFSQVCFIFAMMVWVEDRGSCCLVLMPVSTVSGDLICCRYHLWEAMCCGCGRSIDRFCVAVGQIGENSTCPEYQFLHMYVDLNCCTGRLKKKRYVGVRIPFVLRTDSYICKLIWLKVRNTITRFEH